MSDGSPDFAYIAHEIHPWEPLTSRTMRYIAGFDDGTVVDITKLCAGRTDREVIKRLDLAVWYEQPKLRAPRGVNPVYTRQIQDSEAYLRGVLVDMPEPAAPHRDEPTVSAPPRDERAVSYAPTLGQSRLDELYTGYATNNMQDKANVVQTLGMLFTEDLQFRSKYVCIEDAIDAIDAEGARQGLSDGLLAELVQRVCAVWPQARVAYYADDQNIRRRKKGPDPKQNYRADKFAGVSAGTYTQRVRVGRIA